MPLIEWNSRLSVGVNEMDEQHKKWISIINNLHDSIMGNKANDVLENIVDDMNNYAFYHFSEEEKLLKNIGYPDLSDHSRAHLEFEREIDRLKADISSRKGVLGTQVMSILRNWLLNHIIVEDMKYSEFIKKANIQLASEAGE